VVAIAASSMAGAGWLGAITWPRSRDVGRSIGGGISIVGSGGAVPSGTVGSAEIAPGRITVVG
jgi:hypothetical protein